MQLSDYFFFSCYLWVDFGGLTEKFLHKKAFRIFMQTYHDYKMTYNIFKDILKNRYANNNKFKKYTAG